LLVESSWHHRKPYRLSAEMVRRRDGQSPLVRARADQANRRLNQRWRTFDARKKRPTVAAVGVARELAGWCWSLAVMDGANDNSAIEGAEVAAIRLTDRRREDRPGRQATRGVTRG
jgi:hypothetical protein